VRTLVPQIKYWVNFRTRPYGKSSRMFHNVSIPATSKRDAQGWVSTFKKDKLNSHFEIEKRKEMKR